MVSIKQTDKKNKKCEVMLNIIKPSKRRLGVEGLQYVNYLANKLRR
jgi:hypothetical protein